MVREVHRDPSREGDGLRSILRFWDWPASHCKSRTRCTCAMEMLFLRRPKRSARTACARSPGQSVRAAHRLPRAQAARPAARRGHVEVLEQHHHDLEQVRALIGHNRIDTTQIYASIRPPQLKRAVASYEQEAVQMPRE